MRTRIIMIVGLSLTIFGAFQNCSSGNVPDTTSTTASVASAAPDLVAGSLVVIATPNPVASGGTVTFSSTMTNISSATYSCTNSAGSVVANGSLSATQTSFPLVVSDAVSCVFQGNGANLIAAVSSVVNVTLSVPAATIPVVVTPAQTWTWQGLAGQTTCNKNGICDGIEWASCAGTACAAPKIQCYNATAPGQSGHAIGLTQTTQPDGYNCMLLSANQGFVIQ